MTTYIYIYKERERERERERDWVLIVALGQVLRVVETTRVKIKPMTFLNTFRLEMVSKFRI